MALQPPSIRDRRVVILIDRPFEERVNEIANRHYEGNRSLLVRTAIRELVERQEREDEREERQAA